MFYLSKADPLMVLRDLLGHSSVLVNREVHPPLGYHPHLPGSLRSGPEGRRAWLSDAVRIARWTPSSTTTPPQRRSDASDRHRSVSGDLHCVFSDGRTRGISSGRVAVPGTGAGTCCSGLSS